MSRNAKKRHAIPDGIILPGTKNADRLGFGENVFDGYIWKDQNEIWISDITSKIPKEGNFSKFTKYLNDLGYKIIVPTPIQSMPEVLKHLGFEISWVPWEPSERFALIRAPRTGNIWHRHKMGMLQAGLFIPEGQMVQVWIRETSEKH